MEKSFVVSLSFRTFDDALVDALKDGKRCTISGVDNRVANAIVYSKEEHITINGETFPRHRNFSLVLSTNIREVSQIF